jgi:3-dehydroquinate synthase
MVSDHKIRVRLEAAPDRSYDIIVKPGVLNDVPGFLKAQWKGKNIYLITDSHVAPLYGAGLLRGFAREGMNARLFEIPAGEASKREAIIHSLYGKLLAAGVRRDSLIIALGGGVVGDVAGFVAATILRGIRYIQIPTSLLAQVDSSVGGKVGIDHRSGKNLIGAFHQPVAVYADPSVLGTLPDIEFRNGLAEVVKIAAALDASLFERIERDAVTILQKSPGVLARVVKDAAGLKASVVESDEFETGLRKSLNVGHTIGHALEAVSDYTLKHGMAVAAGTVLESMIAVEMGILDRANFDRLIHLLQTLRLPVAPPKVAKKKKFFSALSVDKKSEGGRPRFVLLNAIGSCVVGIDVPAELIRKVIAR